MESIHLAKTEKHGGQPLGKIEASLNEKLRRVNWGEYKLGDLFEIENTLSFNTEKLVPGMNMTMLQEHH